MNSQGQGELGGSNTHIKDTQRLDTEIEILQIVLYLVMRKRSTRSWLARRKYATFS